MSDIAALFQDRDYCLAEMRRIRQSLGTIKATDAAFESAESVLSFMWLYCPEDLRNLVEAQLKETGRRRVHMLFRRLQSTPV